MPRTGRPREPLEARFWAKVDRWDPDHCWLWTGALNGHGYAQIGMGGRGAEQRGAHRVAYEFLVGAIPPGRQLDHLCKVRNCVNPKHLEAVTAQVNTLRSDGRPAHNARKTHCLRGHALSGANLYLWRGTRLCRACRSGSPLIGEEEDNG